MTCIVGLEDTDRVWIGADSAGVAGYDIRKRADTKIFRLLDDKKALLGYTTSFRMGQLLMYQEGLMPRKNEFIDSHHLMVSGFIPKVRDLFLDGGFTSIEGNTESAGTFLLGYEEELWTVESDFQVARNLCGYQSVGCGSPYAMGSLHSTEKIYLRPKLRVLAALRAAAQFNAGVSPPFTIMNTKDNKKYIYKE